MTEENTKDRIDEVKLKVAEAVQDDVNKGIVRIDSKFQRILGVRPGDIVEIEGERKTLAIVDRAYPSDFGLEIVRMDGLLRKNAKVSIGDFVIVRRAEVKPAKKVVISPTSNVVIQGSLGIFKKGLLGRPVYQGDIISISSGNKKRKSVGSSNPLFSDFFNLFEEDFLGFNLGNLRFKVVNTKPNKEPLIITEETDLEILNKPVSEDEEERITEVTYEDIGGLKSQLTKIRELVELPLRHPELFDILGIEAPKGILLYGPPGTGKTLLARAIANESEASFYSINAPEIVNKYYGESEKKLREIFEEASKNSPSIIFIDEIDAIAVKREEVTGETEKRIVAQLLTLMDGLNKNKKVIVIAATNRPDTLDEALRRPGRFDRELEIGVPKEQDRLEILKIHTRGMPFDTPSDFKVYEKELKKFIEELKEKNLEDDKGKNIDVDKIKEVFSKDKYKALSLMPEEVVNKIMNKEKEKILKKVAAVTHGFVGADLEALVKEAAFNVLRRNFKDNLFLNTDRIPKERLNRLKITEEDISEALKVIRPSAMREFLVEKPNVKWDDIGGLEEIKKQLIEMLEWPLKKPESFRRLGISPPKGILLYGPPGTGKTLLGKAVATETETNFIYVKGPQIISKWVGESEKAIRKIFEKARQSSPSIIFFDEFDAIASSRLGGREGKSTDKIVNQILTELDGLEELINVKVIAATNRPNLIDPALLRPGRFDKLLLVNVPDIEARKAILKVYLNKMPVENPEKVIEEISKNTEGYVGADLEALCREAGLIALRENINSKVVSLKHFKGALKVIKPSVNPELAKDYEEIEKSMKNPKKLDGISMTYMG